MSIEGRAFAGLFMIFYKFNRELDVKLPEDLEIVFNAFGKCGDIPIHELGEVIEALQEYHTEGEITKELNDVQKCFFEAIDKHFVS